MHLSRRDFVKAVGLSAPGLLGARARLWAAEDGAAETKPPNIVYILADDLGYGDLGCYGQERIQTPCIDNMAAEGMRFTQHYAGSTVCAPSRAALMLGLHTGHLQTPGQGQGLRLQDRTIAELLKAGGYATGGIGKWGLGQEGSDGIPTKKGFDVWFGYLNQTHAHNYYPTFLWRNEQKVKLRNVVTRHPKRPESLGGAATERTDYSHDLFTAEALSFIERNRSRPFFLYLPYTIPHANNEAGILKRHGMEVPDLGVYADKDWPEPQKGHAAMISRLDRDVGQILARLRGLGLDRNTLVMFSSDNGPHREGGADPEFFDSNGPVRGMKRDLYDGGIRVPLIAWWPGTIKAGSVSDHLSAFYDLLPTACEIAGIPVPNGRDGVSFLPELLGKPQQRHDYLYWEFLERGGKQALRMGRWKAVRQDLNKDIDGPIELYDVEQDIGEARDISAEHPDVVARAQAIFSAVRRENPVERPYVTRAAKRRAQRGPKPPAPDIRLSDLQPVRATSGFEPLGPPKMDRSIRGEPLTVAGKTYERGVGVHAPSELIYALDGRCKAFVAIAGVDDERPGSVGFEVHIDGKQVVHTPVLTKGETWPINVPIPEGSKQIRLVVNDGGNGTASDHADWLEAGFATRPVR